MPVDPQIQALLDKAADLPATHTLPVAEARRQMESRIGAMAPPAAVGGVEEYRMAGPAGPLRLRIYTPKVGSDAYPLVVFFHGSGCAVQPRHARRHVPQSLRGRGLRHHVGRLPLGAGAQIPGGTG